MSLEDQSLVVNQEQTEIIRWTSLITEDTDTKHFGCGYIDSATEDLSIWSQDEFLFVWACEEIDSKDHDEALVVIRLYKDLYEANRDPNNIAMTKRLNKIGPGIFGQALWKAIDWKRMIPNYFRENRTTHLVPCIYYEDKLPRKMLFIIVAGIAIATFIVVYLLMGLCHTGRVVPIIT